MDTSTENHAEVKLPQRNISSIKNKQRRAEAFRQLKKEKTKVRLGSIMSEKRQILPEEFVVNDNRVFWLPHSHQQQMP